MLVWGFSQRPPGPSPRVRGCRGFIPMPTAGLPWDMFIPHGLSPLATGPREAREGSSAASRPQRGGFASGLSWVNQDSARSPPAAPRASLWAYPTGSPPPQGHGPTLWWPRAQPTVGLSPWVKTLRYQSIENIEVIKQ